jgi:hypothetical protein
MLSRPAVVQTIKIAEVEIFTQTWLVFGLLCEIFGRVMSLADFCETHEDGERKFLSMAKLPGIFEEWIDLNRASSDNANKKALLRHYGGCIMEAYDMLGVLVKVPNIAASIIWTTACILETVQQVTLNVLNQGNVPWFQPISWTRFNNFDDTNGHLIRAGWCPADVKAAQEVANGMQDRFYLSKLTQPGIKDHSRCNSNTCAVHHDSMNRQGMLHRSVDCDCNMVEVDMAAVNGCLEGGTFALLQVIGEDDPATTRVEVVSSARCHPYVALSHVWVDGLGNPAANALPRCQVAYVARAIKQLQEKVGQYFLLWLDTLCCPVESLEHRQLCLLRMRQIYQEAHHVLVLDASLACYSAQELDAVEISARLLFSPWQDVSGHYKRVC